ncbi:hypothetical protein SAMN05192562_1186 [Kosakonia arachidis]|uniref:Uncharacterized protein n=1 Tax=Kosakonia arachidis TaxID=551989 RepID=A0A1I7EBX8_9ENTR|nr:hypothetical protein SAMN05192562_1186 [Kosakonia arachidis]
MQQKNCTKRSIAHILHDALYKRCNFTQLSIKKQHYVPQLCASKPPSNRDNIGHLFGAAALTWCKKPSP